MSDQPDHLRDFRAALAAEGFEPGKIGRNETKFYATGEWTKPTPPEPGVCHVIAWTSGVSGIDEALAMAQPVLEALEAAEAQMDAERAKERHGGPLGGRDC